MFIGRVSRLTPSREPSFGIRVVHWLAAVRWDVARRIVWAWILTIPASALVAGAVFWAVRFFTGRRSCDLCVPRFGIAALGLKQ